MPISRTATISLLGIAQPVGMYAVMPAPGDAVSLADQMTLLGLFADTEPAPPEEMTAEQQVVVDLRARSVLVNLLPARIIVDLRSTAALIDK